MSIYREDVLKFNFAENPSDFSKSISSMTTDGLRGAAFSYDKFTGWDMNDTKYYLEDMLYRLQYEVTMLQMPNQEYIDFEKPECLAYGWNQIKDDCIITEKPEKPDIMNIVKIMKNLLGAYAIDDKQRKYMDLTNSESWVGATGLHTIVKFDIDTPYDMGTGSWPFQELAGLFDIVYQMIEADYLGSSFQSPWDIGIALIYGGGGGGMEGRVDLSCEGQRGGCYWKNERDQAREFFFSRVKKSKLIFNYDLDIISDDFKYHRSKIRAKYDRLMELENRGDEFIKYVKKEGGFGDIIQISIYKKPSKLIPLSPNYLNNKRKFEMFFVEETESFFLKDHNWADFKIQ